MTDWLVLDGYLTSAEQTNFLAQFPVYKGGFPDEKDVYTLPEGRSCAWKRVSAKGDYFNVRAAAGKDFQGKSAFVFCTIIADKAGDVELLMSARPDVVLWLNGQKLSRGAYYYEDRFRGKGTWSYEGNLRAGANGLLIQISQLGLDRGFGLRVLPPERTVFSGKITDSKGTAAGQGVAISAWQQGRELARIRTSERGAYRLSLMAAGDAPCDISFTDKDGGCWRLGEQAPAGGRRTLDVTMHPAVSLSGTLTMLDASRSPHREVIVQALRDGAPAVSVFSDEKGHYQFINLRPGDYRIRCETAAGYLYYRPPSSNNIEAHADSVRLKVEENKTTQNLDITFAAFKKGFWKRYDTFDGLPNNSVSRIALAPSGALWFQTSTGLGYYDGRTFSTIAGTENRPITALAAAPDGAIWFGTYTGLYRLKNGTLDCFTVTNGLPDNLITCVRAARSGEIWVGTEYGLSQYDGREFHNFTMANGLVSDQIIAIDQAPDGAIWLGTGGGVSRYDGKQFLNFTTEDGLPGNEVTALDCSSGGKILVASNEGIASFNGQGFAPLFSPGQFEPAWTKALHTGNDGRLWMGSERGVSVFDGTNLVHIHPQDGLGGGRVESIVETPEGFLWFATFNGVARLDPGFANYTTMDGMADNRVFDVCHTAGGLWFGMEWGGIGRFDGKAFYTVQPNLYARKLHQDASGTLWIGSDKGAISYHGVRPLPDRLLGNRWIMAIDHDASNALWLGDGWSGGGLAMAQTNSQGVYQIKTWTKEDGLGDNEVYDILCLPGKITWLATAGGLTRYDGIAFKNFTKKDGLPDNMVRAVRPGANGTLWVGTDGGIGRYDGRTFVNISAAYGLPPSRIWCIHTTKDGLVWFGTDTLGAFAFDGQAFSTFDTRDGLADNSVMAIEEDDAGKLWFGTARGGLTCFSRKTNAPKVRFTQIKAGGRVLPMNTTLLRAGEPVTVSYEALDWLTPAAKKQFRISQRPAETGAGTPAASAIVTRRTDFDWIPERAGNVTLEVQAINQYLVYSSPATMAFTVFVPWHEQTVWRVSALMAATMLLASALLLVSNYLSQRAESRRLKDRMLEQEQAARAALEGKNIQLELRAAELKEQQRQLEEALANVKTLRGLVPICAGCKKIRDDNGFWEHLESFVEKHSEAQFSHGMCPDCIQKWYPHMKI